MALTIKQLASGGLPAAASEPTGSGTGIYSPAGISGNITGGKSGLVKSIVLVNTGTATTINIRVRTAAANQAGTSRWVSPIALSIAASAMIVLDNEITLGSILISGTWWGDSIIGWCPVGATVDYVINGLERDI